MLDEEFLGDPSRVKASKQAAELWKLLKSNGQYRYYGRAIGLNEPTEDTAQRMRALARIQGVGICYYCPKEDGARLFAELERSGLKTDHHEHYRAGESAYARSKKLLEEKSLPPDLKAVRIDDTSSRDLLASVVAVGEAEGVTPVPSSVIGAYRYLVLSLPPSTETESQWPVHPVIRCSIRVLSVAQMSSGERWLQDQIDAARALRSI